jgi:UDP:flavonoid glycosyltransferase YjiC (YdhE family)
VRVLLTTTAGSGHFGPMIPFAAAWRAVGHDVIVAAPASFRAPVERAGFDFRPFADAPQDELDAVFSTLHAVSVDEGNIRVVRDVFATIDASAALPGVNEVIAEWRPDVVVRESCEFAAYIAAERHELPQFRIGAGFASFEETMVAHCETTLNALRQSVGLEPDPGLRRLQASPRLTTLPASADDDAPGVASQRFSEKPRDASQALPDWWNGASDPLVYVSFGTVAATVGMFPDLYLAAAGALADVTARILMTTGGSADPAALGSLPPNVHVERWCDEGQVLPQASVVVGHGGFGTLLRILAAGVPMVAVPLFGDQGHNARRIRDTGIGIALDGGPAAIGELGEAVKRVLGDPTFGSAARRVAEEMRSQPDVSTSADLLFRATRP